MFFKLDGTVRGLQLSEGTELVFSLKSPTLAVVRLWHSPTVPLVNGQAAVNTAASITIEREPEPMLRSMFDSLAQGNLPAGSDLSQRMNSADEAGAINPDSLIPWEVMPPTFQTFGKGMRDEMWSLMSRTVRAYLWRCGATSEHSPLIRQGFWWSLDSAHWTLMPITMRARLDAYITVWRFDSETLSEVADIVAGGQSQPLSRELYLEAWNQRHANPRSALVLGVAAAETGVKQFIGEVVPAAQWLMDKLQSPSIVQLVNDYLPTLRQPDKAISPPPKAIRKQLQVAMELRNQVVHGQEVNLKSDQLADILAAVNDLLWMLDYWRGFPWALAYVRDETQREWVR